MKADTFTVVFRGAFMPESGIENVIDAAKILEKEKIRFIILGGGIFLEKIKKLVEDARLPNLELITEFLPYEKIREIMQKCHISLGQISDHERLTRTIPHKAYESLAMRLPYLTAANIGILELLTPDKTCLTCNTADANSLVDKILWARNNYSSVEEVAKNGYELYQKELRPSILAQKLLDKIIKL